MPTLNTAVVLPLIVYLHPNGVVRVCWEPGATSAENIDAVKLADKLETL